MEGVWRQRCGASRYGHSRTVRRLQRQAGVGLESNLPACRCQCAACAILKERVGLGALAQSVARATGNFSVRTRHEDNLTATSQIRGVFLGGKWQIGDGRVAAAQALHAPPAPLTCSHQTNLSTPNVGDQSRVASRRRRKGARRTGARGDVQATQLYLSTVMSGSDLQVAFVYTSLLRRPVMQYSRPADTRERRIIHTHARTSVRLVLVFITVARRRGKGLVFHRAGPGGSRSADPC